LVMEYLAGGTLLEYLNSVGHRLRGSTLFAPLLLSYQERSLDIAYESIRDIMYQLCRAMEYMHNKSFVHRDLKPDVRIIPIVR
jgi:serine/threonine protein kinase